VLASCPASRSLTCRTSATDSHPRTGREHDSKHRQPLATDVQEAPLQHPVNPTTGLEIIAARNKPKRITTPDDAARMIDAVPPEDRPIWGTPFYAGLRNGELQALRVEDLDLFEGWGLLHVAGGWDKVEGVVDPKSDAGRRTIPIPEPLYAILDEHLLRLNRTEGLIFGQSATKPLLLSTRCGSGQSGSGAGRGFRFCNCMRRATATSPTWKQPRSEH
jgi:integrase